MFDSFPYDEWGDNVTQFWTWAGQEGNSTGTYILTVLGITAMIISFLGFVILENGKLARQAEALKATGALDRPPDPPSQSTGA